MDKLTDFCLTKTNILWETWKSKIKFYVHFWHARRSDLTNVIEHNEEFFFGEAIEVLRLVQHGIQAPTIAILHRQNIVLGGHLEIQTPKILGTLKVYSQYLFQAKHMFPFINKIITSIKLHNLVNYFFASLWLQSHLLCSINCLFRIFSFKNQNAFICWIKLCFDLIKLNICITNMLCNVLVDVLFKSWS